jgi:hypothetical protein
LDSGELESYVRRLSSQHINAEPAWFVTKICHTKDLAAKTWSKKVAKDLASQM